MIKIAISGKGGVGKNTVANKIQDYLKLNNNEVVISAFAIKIKKIIQLLFPGCNKDSLYGSSELRQDKITSILDNINLDNDVTYRKVSCDIGKLGRSYSPSIWVKHIALEFANLPANTKLYIISDVRFVEEFEWLKINNFTLFRVTRNNLLKIDDVSETEQEKLSDDLFDAIIDNNCSIEQLNGKILSILDSKFCNNSTYLQVRNAGKN